MERLEEQIHLRNIVSCLTELSDYTHYLSYERYLLDEELKKIIFDNLSFIGKEASNLYEKGCRVEGLEYLAALKDASSMNEDSYSIYSLLQNDLDYMADQVKEACESFQPDLYTIQATTFA